MPRVLVSAEGEDAVVFALRILLRVRSQTRGLASNGPSIPKE